MPRKPFPFTAVVALLSAGVMPLFAGPIPRMQPPVSQTGQSRTSLDAEMSDHENQMQALNAKLEESFQAIADARDAKGYVSNNLLVKAHEADIKALRGAFREHKKLLVTYEHQCGVNSKQDDAMIQHQQLMKAMLYDVVETFDTFEVTNEKDPSNIVTEYIGPAFVAHRLALTELSGAIEQHQQAMAQMMKKCS